VTTCKRCGGTGREPAFEIPADCTERQAELLRELLELGVARLTVNRHTAAGRQRLDRIYARIREIDLDIDPPTRTDMARALNVSRTALYNILSTKTGG